MAVLLGKSQGTYDVVAWQFRENGRNTTSSHLFAYARGWFVVEDGIFESTVETFERGVVGIEQYVT